MGCPRVDSNHHAFSGTGPQPAAYTIPPRGLIITDYGRNFILDLEACQSHFERMTNRLRAQNTGCCWLSVRLVSIKTNVIEPFSPVRERTSLTCTIHVTCS